MMHQFISDHWTSESSFPGCLRAYVPPSYIPPCWRSTLSGLLKRCLQTL